MLMPETEPPSHLDRTEVEAALVRMVQDAGAMARAMKLASLIAHGLPAMDGADLLGKAMTLLLAGKRKWRRDLSTLPVLRGVMRSVAWRTRQKPDYLLADDIGVGFDEESESEYSSLAEGVCRESDPGRIIEGQSELAAVQKAVEGEEDLELLIEALAEGLIGMEIVSTLSWDTKRYDAARKRLSRRLAALKKDRS
jgi:hypothetical protein